MDLTYPRPTPCSVTQPFWDGLRKHRVWIQHCADCASFFFYPRAMCPRCWTPDISWQEIPGTGTLHSFTIAHVATAPHFAADVPQKIAVIELDEGPRLTSTLVAIEPTDIAIGMRLAPVFEDLPDIPLTLLRFRPA